VAVTGRARARDLGLAPGALPPGRHNAITDVPGVRVGHATVREGTGLRTGVTAVVFDPILGTWPAGLSVFNGFGKLTGATQVAELGSIETPVLLTATLSVFRVADALLSYLHELAGQDGPASTLNPVVAETNDGFLSDIWARPITPAHVRAALETASGGPVAEGCVGAGTGTGALGFKAGIGTSSRRVGLSDGSAATLGALVQANFSGTLTVRGVPVPVPDELRRAGPSTAGDPTPAGEHGNSCVIVLATDAAAGSRELERIARRAFAGMARCGSDFAGHSGDYALAVSTASRETTAGRAGHVPDKDLDLLFTAAIEATEEAILDSLFMAETTSGYRGHMRPAVPLDYVLARVSGRSAGRGES
jgi:D-aminopeptidase